MKKSSMLAALVSVGCSTAAFSASIKGMSNIELAFDFGDQTPQWKVELQGKQEAHYTWQGHTLSLKIEQIGSQQILGFMMEPPAGQKLDVHSYTAKLTAPTAGLHAVMVPNTRIIAHTLIYFHEHRTWPEKGLQRCLIPEGFEENAYSNTEAPFILLTDNKGNNKLSVGWAAAETATVLKGAGEDGNYALTLTRRNDVPITGGKLEDALIIDTSTRPWMDTERDYAKTYDAWNGRKHSKAPEWAYEPVYCTWYCYTDHIDQEKVLKIAEKCKELGFGTILIDAGWDSKPDGGYGDFETGILGDFTAVPEKFPDMADMVKKIHDMGLRVELWSGPFWEGKLSRSYQEKTKDFHIQSADGKECHELCPKHPGTREHLKERFTWLMKTYKVDGMWLDAADSVPPECHAKHEHLDQSMDEAFVDCMTAIRDAMQAVNPEAITEARVLHANLTSKRALDLVQPSDAPESFEMLRIAGIHIRPWVYDIVLKNDPMMWKTDADAATVGKFLATMVCNGVPGLSVDYLTASDEQCALTKAWLAFYKKHMDTLVKGEFKLFGADYNSPDMMLIGKNEAVVYIKNPETGDVVLPERIKRVILLNCTDSDSLKLRVAMAEGGYKVQAYGPDWSPVGPPAVLDMAPLSYAVPQGGAAVIEVR